MSSLTIGAREVIVGSLLGDALARGTFGQSALMTICGILLLGLWRHQRAASVVSRTTEPGDSDAGLQRQERIGICAGVE